MMNPNEAIQTEVQMIKAYADDIAAILADPAFTPELKAKMIDGKARSLAASANGLKDAAYNLGRPVRS